MIFSHYLNFGFGIKWKIYKQNTLKYIVIIIIKLNHWIFGVTLQSKIFFFDSLPFFMIIEIIVSTASGNIVGLDSFM